MKKIEHPVFIPDRYYKIVFESIISKNKFNTYLVKAIDHEYVQCRWKNGMRDNSTGTAYGCVSIIEITEEEYQTGKAGAKNAEFAGILDNEY